MVEVAVAVLTKISESLVAPIENQLSYFFQLSGNVKTLEKELEKLKILKVFVQQEVDLARNNVHTILDHVETWLGRVDTVESEARRIVQHNAQFLKGCLNGWCLNLKPRYVLSRQAKKKTEDIGYLLQEGIFSIVSLPPPPEQFIGYTSTEVLNSREVNLNEIIEILKDKDVNLIGLCGMGGMGKTTMVEKVFNRVKEEKMFDDCVMTVVSQKAEMINVQRDIAESLKLTFEENNLNLRAGLLKKRLKGKKVLIIFDDVWDEFELKALGITFQDGQRGCKVVFTSRTQGLWREHGSRRCELLLQTLPDDESWTLFKGKMGDSLNDKPEVELIAKEIVKECAGLPLALGILGSALHGQKKHVWNDTLHKLKLGGVDDKVFKILRVSYDRLCDEEAKSVFLLCSLFEEDSHIDVENLVNMGMGLRLFRGIDRVEEARDRVLTLVDHLQFRCLVSIVSNSDRARCFIKVHDVVRDVSKSTAFSEKGSLVLEHGFTLEKSLEESSTYHYTWISDISGESMELLSTLQFPRLEVLRCSYKYLEISENCFDGMVKLLVVDVICPTGLYNPSIKKLPLSLQSLTSLHTLCLGNFRLEDFTAIKFLLSLEILRIGYEFIVELPKEIGHLTKLRLLDMSDCENLKRILPGTISGLSNLEELYLGGLIIDWGAEETEEGGNAAHGEFESLFNLRILHFAIKDLSMLPRTRLLKNLNKYQIQIGNAGQDFIITSRNYEKKVSISDVALVKNSTFLLHNSEALLLMGESTKRLVSELVREASQSIKYLEIHDTDTPEYLANATDCSKPPFLVSTLESLTLSKLKSLQHIINGPLMAGHFTKLKKLGVIRCNQLRNIFRLSNGVDVLHLEEFRVNYCESMVEIICWERTEEDATSKLQFPKLKDLEIGCESLVCFCRGAKEIEIHQLETLRLSSIPAVECITSSIPNDVSLDSIFPHKVLFPSLVKMELVELKNMKEIWCGQIQSGSFVNLTTLEIEGCDSLEYVFSLYTATYLVHLRALTISNCPSLKEILNGSVQLMAGSLLKLNDLTVYRCNQLRNIFRLSTAVNTVDLKELYIEDCESIEEVISWEGRPEDATTSKLFFPKIETLVIDNSSYVKCFCKGAMDIEFHQLSYLHLMKLQTVECLVSISNENPLNSIFPHKVLFPNLVVMRLTELQNMKEIWCGQLQSGSFVNLSELEIEGCDGLEHIFIPCMARYLVHLRRLDIAECKNLKEVISTKEEVDGSEEYTRSILPKLKDVKLCKLLALETFYHVATDIEFPELDDVRVTDCPVFKSFSPGFVHTPVLNHVKTYNQSYVTMWKGNLNSTIQHLHEALIPQKEEVEEEEEEEDLSA